MRWNGLSSVEYTGGSEIILMAEFDVSAQYSFDLLANSLAPKGRAVKKLVKII